MTDPLGQSQVLPYIGGLSKEGYQFDLVSFEKRDRFKENREVIEKICKRSDINWHPLFYTKNPPVLSTVWDAYRLLKKAKELHAREPFDLTHCRSYISSLIGLYLKKRFEVKFLFDMRGFWADERVDGKLWDLRNPLFKAVYKFFKGKEKEFLIYSDKIVSLTEQGLEEMLTWSISELTLEKVKIIPCAADHELFQLADARKKKAAKQKLGLKEDNFVLSYIGSLGTWYLVDEMLQFFSLLKKQIPSSRFLFLTPDDKNIILNHGRRYGLEEADFIIMFSARDELPQYANASDFSIFFIKPAYSKRSSCPTKMGELMAIGIPIICNSGVGDVEQIVKNTRCGICLNELNEKAFMEIAAKLEYWNESSHTSIRESSKEYFDLEKGIHSYLSIYQELFAE